jgi:hypothetical protein
VRPGLLPQPGPDLRQKKNFKLNWMYLGEPLWYTVPKFVTYVFRNW